MNRPLVPRDDFWADLVNAFFLRSVYRTPTSSKQEEPHQRATPGVNGEKKIEGRPRHSALDDEAGPTLQSGEETDLSASVRSYLGDSGWEIFNIAEEKSNLVGPASRSDILMAVAHAQQLTKDAQDKIEHSDFGGAKADLVFAMSFLRVATNASPQMMSETIGPYLRAASILNRLNITATKQPTGDAHAKPPASDVVKGDRSADYTEVDLDSDDQSSTNGPDDDDPYPPRAWQ